MRPPRDGSALTSEQQLHGVRIGRLLQHPQVELDHAPTDDDIRVMVYKPGIQLLDHLPASRTIDKSEVHRWHSWFRHRSSRWRLPQHEDHPVARTIQCDRVKLLGRARLDVQRHHLQHRAPTGRGLQAAVEDGRAFALASLNQDTGCDEPLHQVAVVRADIRFVQRDSQRLEFARELAQIAEPAGIDTEDRLLLERLQP